MAQMNVNVNFEADDLESGRKTVEGWKVPEGATVSITAAETVTGHVKKGKVVEPPPVGEPPA